MSYLPIGTALGDLRITEVIEYYDRPLLFACQNTLDHLYLAVLVDEADGVEFWLYAPMSVGRWQQIRANAIDLHDAFAAAETGQVWRIEQATDSGEVLHCNAVACSELSVDELPLTGVYADMPPETLVLPGENDVRIRAERTLRAAIDLVLRSSDMLGFEFPAKALGTILTAFQDLFTAIVQAVYGTATTRGPVSSAVQSIAELRTVGVSPGSFRVQLSAVPFRGMFDPGDIGSALEQLGDLLSATGSDERVSALLSPTRQRIVTQYGDLLKQVVNAKTSASIEWYSPDHRGGHALVSLEAAGSTLAYLDSVSQVMDSDIDVIGTLEGFMLSDGRFEFREAGDGGKCYRGSAGSEAIKVISQATLGRGYHACIHVREVFKPLNPEPDITYTLTRLDRLGVAGTEDVSLP